MFGNQFIQKVKYSLCAVGLGARDTLRIEAGYPCMEMK